MATRKRLRWTAILCNHAIANMAFYRGGYDGKRLIRNQDAWRRAHGNFMDIAVLEWCKLFADPGGDHCWRNVVADPAGFEAGLLAHVGLTEAKFRDYCNGVLRYRDKFVAHLDKNAKAKVPVLDVAIESTIFFYGYLLTHEDGGDYFVNLPRRAAGMYRATLTQAKHWYTGTD